MASTDSRMDWIMEFLQVSMKWPLFVALGGALALIG